MISQPVCIAQRLVIFALLHSDATIPLILKTNEEEKYSMKKLLSFAAIMVLSAAMVFSANLQNSNAQSAALTISPRRDLQLKPGESVTDQLYIQNPLNDQEITLSLELVDFGAKDETGTPALRLGENEPQTAWSAKPFLDLPERVTLGPSETLYVDYTASIPEGHGAGSYYSAVRYTVETTVGGGNLTLSTSGATLIFITVPGRANEILNLKNFGAYEISPGEAAGKFKTIFVGSKPKELAYLLENKGDVAAQPVGGVLIKNMFGKVVQTVDNANPKKQLALIGQTRRFQACIIESGAEEQSSNDAIVCEEPSLWPGRYTAQLAAFYGINGNSTQEIAATATFWYLPVWFLIAVAVLLAAIALVIYLLIHRIRSGGGKRQSFRKASD